MKRKESGSAGCLLLCLPLAAVGTVMSYLYVADVTNWARMHTWKEVPARILSADLESSRSRGSKSFVYEAFAEYEYEYQGKKYRGSRISRYFGNDNIGKFYQDIYSEISTYRNSQQLFRCYVNPDSPEEAILYRNMRLGMLCLYGGLGGILGGIGWGMLAGMLAAYIRDKRDSALQKQYPGQPWKWRKDWIRGEARAAVASEIFVLIAISILCAVFSFPILIFALAGLQKGNFAALFALIYPLVAIFIIKWAIGSILQWLRFGRAVFQLNTIPVRPGERLRGIIRTGGKLPASAEVRLELRQFKRAGDESEWSQNTTTMPIVGTDGKTCIQVDLEIPEQISHPKKESRKSNLQWELHAVSKIPGVDLDATFKIPIFQTD